MAAVLNAALKLYTGLLATHVRDKLTGKAHKLLMERMNYYKANWVTEHSHCSSTPSTHQPALYQSLTTTIQQLSPLPSCAAAAAIHTRHRPPPYGSPWCGFRSAEISLKIATN